MMRSLWVSKSGMEAQQTQLDHISNNLANSGTNGFKQTHAVFEDLMYQNMRQSGANSSDQTTLPTGLQAGLGVRAVASSPVIQMRPASASSSPAIRRNKVLLPDPLGPMTAVNEPFSS